MSIYQSLLRPVLFFSMLAGAAVALGACNTMEGFGEDAESAGEAIQDEAE